MKKYQKEFIEYSLKKKALKFGNFILKSGRISPYYFNISLFNSGEDLAFLGKAYVSALIDSGILFDMIFGPAYKGIILATSIVLLLKEKYKINASYCVSRKEIKNHGEGGKLIGAPIKGRIMLIDDVITTGMVIRESKIIISNYPAILSGILIALDRQEKDSYGILTNKSIEKNCNCKIISIITIKEIIMYLKEKEKMMNHYKSIIFYQKKYGTKI